MGNVVLYLLIQKKMLDFGISTSGFIPSAFCTYLGQCVFLTLNKCNNSIRSSRTIKFTCFIFDSIY